jgi:hypothetical protein
MDVGAVVTGSYGNGTGGMELDRHRNGGQMKPDRAAVGQRWAYDDLNTYTVTAVDGDWAEITWERDKRKDKYEHKHIVCDQYLGYALEAPGNGQALGVKAAAWLRGVADMLEDKSKQYGDSAGNPIRVFSKADVLDGVMVRLDDKLSRMKRGAGGSEDHAKDFVGYMAMAVAAGWDGTLK